MGEDNSRTHPAAHSAYLCPKKTMSKIPAEALKETIKQLLDESAAKKRKFVETIELQIVLKNYDTQKDKRFAGSIKLPNLPRPRMSCCILGDAKHVEAAKSAGIPCMDVEALKALNKDKLGKFPTLVEHSDDLIEKIDGIKSTVKFQLKKVLTMGVAAGHVEMTPDQVYANTMITVNFLVSLLKKNWQNIKTLHIKSAMGASNRIY